MENLTIAVSAVIPFLIFLVIGYAGRKSGIVREKFLRELNSVNFKCFFPFVMFNNLYKMEFDSLAEGTYIVFAVTATVILLLVSWITVPVIVKEDRRRSVVIQAIYRSNAVLFAIPLAGSVCGEAGMEKASLLTAFIIPLYNISAVILLEYYRGGKVSVKSMGMNILKNPIIKGAIAGFLFAVSPLEMPDFLGEPITQLAGMATPLALFVLGGTLHFSHLRKNLACLAAGSVLKLAVVPGVIIAAMHKAGFDGAELFAVFCMFATPVATASYPMAQSMGADGDLAGEFVVVTTAASIFTMFLWILFLKNTGMV